MWEYLCNSKQIDWDKKQIKQYIKTHNPPLFNWLKFDRKKSVHTQGHHIDVCGEKNKSFYIRALLGLAEQYEFLKFDGERIKVRIDDVLKFEKDEHLKAKAVVRFTSPLRYFISDTSIFATTTKIPDELTTYRDSKDVQSVRKFRFSIDGVHTGSDLELPIPSGFDLEDFITKKAGYGANLK